MARYVVGITLLALILAACGDTAATLPDPTTTTMAATTTTAPSATTVTTSPATTTTSTTTTTIVLDALADVTTHGLGPVRIGMTVEEAEAAAGVVLEGELDPELSEDCYFVTPVGDPALEGVTFMVYQDQIGRVDISPPSAITTRSGAGIGMTEEELQDLFPDNLEDASDFVVDGTALQYVPSDESVSEYRVVFEIAEGAVITYRAGILPAVGFGEGCA